VHLLRQDMPVMAVLQPMVRLLHLTSLHNRHPSVVILPIHQMFLDMPSPAAGCRFTLGLLVAIDPRC
jgi:hypothetical protein